MIHKPFFCIDKFYISIKSIMATLQLFVLPVKLKMLMFGKDAINSITIHKELMSPIIFSLSLKNNIYIYLKAHLHTTVQSGHWFSTSKRS